MEKVVLRIFLLLVLLPVVAAAQTRIDVMVAYTPACRNYHGGTNGVRAFIDTAIAAANTAYANSQINLRLRLVHTVEVNYTENPCMVEDLDRLAFWNDGYFDEVHTLRATYGADLVCLMRRNATNGVAGIAYFMGSPTTPSYYAAFSVVADNYAVNAHVFAHELGHNMGADHARTEAAGGGSFGYSYGHRFYGTRANRHMGYSHRRAEAR